MEGFEWQIIGLLLAFKARNKQKKKMLEESTQKKLVKAELKGNRDLKNLLSTWNFELRLN